MALTSCRPFIRRGRKAHRGRLFGRRARRCRVDNIIRKTVSVMYVTPTLSFEYVPGRSPTSLAIFPWCAYKKGDDAPAQTAPRCSSPVHPPSHKKLPKKQLGCFSRERACSAAPRQSTTRYSACARRWSRTSTFGRLPKSGRSATRRGPRGHFLRSTPSPSRRTSKGNELVGVE